MQCPVDPRRPCRRRGRSHPTTQGSRSARRWRAGAFVRRQPVNGAVVSRVRHARGLGARTDSVVRPASRQRLRLRSDRWSKATLRWSQRASSERRRWPTVSRRPASARSLAARPSRRLTGRPDDVDRTCEAYTTPSPRTATAEPHGDRVPAIRAPPRPSRRDAEPRRRCRWPSPGAVGGSRADGVLVEPLREVQALEHELDRAGDRGRATRRRRSARRPASRSAGMLADERDVRRPTATSSPACTTVPSSNAATHVAEPLRADSGP